MYETYETHHGSNERAPLRRINGIVGGVSAGVARTLGVAPIIIRIGLVAASLVLGPVVLFGYLLAWFAIPADERLPASQRPGSVPRTLLGIVAAVIAIQIVFGLIANLPIGWIALGAFAVYWFFVRD